MVALLEQVEHIGECCGISMAISEVSCLASPDTTFMDSREQQTMGKIMSVIYSGLLLSSLPLIKQATPLSYHL